MKNFSIFIFTIFLLFCNSFLLCQTKENTFIKEDFDFDNATDDEIAVFILHGGYKADRIKEKIGLDVPEFFGEDIERNLFSSRQTKRIVFYNSWFSNCAPCIKEIPFLNEIYEKYKNDVDFIALTFMPIEKIKSTIEKHPFYFKHISIDRTLLQKNVIQEGNGYPISAIVVDNKIIYYKLGGIGTGKYKELTEKYWYNELDSILGNAIKNNK
jgi:thiol-disulfide isomerase/thioredoxin